MQRTQLQRERERESVSHYRTIELTKEREEKKEPRFVIDIAASVGVAKPVVSPTKQYR